MSGLRLARDGFELSDDLDRIDLDIVHGFLTTSYWSPGISRERVERALRNSVSVGLYESGRQIGFARAVTDHATFAWLADVFVLEPWRGRGLATWMVGSLVNKPGFDDLRRWLLATASAHRVYAGLGFEPLKDPERFMTIRRAVEERLGAHSNT